MDTRWKNNLAGCGDLEVGTNDRKGCGVLFAPEVAAVIVEFLVKKRIITSFCDFESSDRLGFGLSFDSLISCKIFAEKMIRCFPPKFLHRIVGLSTRSPKFMRRIVGVSPKFILCV
jgi:hypothetical protein